MRLLIDDQDRDDKRPWEATEGVRPGAKVGGTSHSKNTADHAFTLQQLEHRDTEMDGT